VYIYIYIHISKYEIPRENYDRISPAVKSEPFEETGFSF